jgi:hypothetical protein
MKHLKRFENINSNDKTNEIMNIGNKLKRELKANKINGFFDWQYFGEFDDPEITYEFYWNEITSDYIFYIYDFMKVHENLKPILKTGKHDYYNGQRQQIVLEITMKIN